MEANGYTIHKCQVVHANPFYLRHGAIDPSALTCFTDVTDDVEKKLAETQEQATQAVSIINSQTIPDIDPLIAAPSFFAAWLQI